MRGAMVKVTVKVMSWLAEDLPASEVPPGGLPNPTYVEFEEVIPSGTRLSELLSALGQRHPKLAKKISIGEGGKPALALVTLNGKIASGEQELTAQLKDGDVVGLLPIFMGG